MRNDDVTNVSIRLNKLLARFGLCSRRKADEWIRDGRVTVDGIVCKELGVHVDPTQQIVAVDGKTLAVAPAFVYIVLNKPAGVVSTRHDPQGRRTVMEYLPHKHIEQGVFPVGRLDRDSEGLLILTNDGDWAQILLHPRHEIWKEYIVETDKMLTPSQKRQLETGIMLDGSKTLPAKIRCLNPSRQGYRRFNISIREGRNRQIRRMCREIGLEVTYLKRVKIGPIMLGNLKLGEWKNLTRQEIESIIAMK